MVPHIVSNIYLAERMRPGEDPDYYLGATLPHFFELHQNVTGVVVPRGPFNAWQPFAAGIQLSNDARPIQGQHPLYKDLVKLAVIDLSAVNGIDQRRSPETATTIIDLAMDGVISKNENSEVVLAIDAIARHLATDTSALASVEAPEHFAPFVREYFARKSWRRYRSALAIAEVLKLRAAARPSAYPRIAEAMVPDLTEVAHKQVGRVGKWSWRILNNTFATLEGDRPRRH